MEKLPNGGEVGEVLGFEDLAEVHLNEGWPREAGVVAHEPKLVAVGAKAPESVLCVIQPVLQRRSGGSPASFARKVRTGAVQIVGGRNDDYRNAALLGFESDGVTVVAARFNVCET